MTNEQFIKDLEARHMSSWTAQEMHDYSVLTEQECPNCGTGFVGTCKAASHLEVIIAVMDAAIASLSVDPLLGC